MMNPKRNLAFLVMLCGILTLLLLKSDCIYTELTFSRESGFYEEPFELELYAPLGTEIFYTLDGSEPNEYSMKYEKPIKITDATENGNVYAMRTDMSARFITDGSEYIVPDYNIDKCTVIRSICRDKNGRFSNIKTGIYFIGYDTKAGYDNLNIISITTDPDNLFSNETGIYVLGHTYEKYAAGYREPSWQSWKDNYWWWWAANYHEKGSDWERNANIQLFDTERNLLLDKNCGIRIQGGGSRGKIPRSMNIYARKLYDDEGRFYIDLFDTGYMADTVTLFAGGDDVVTKFRDMLMTKLVGGRNFATMNYIPYAMFLDGEYWGIYWLTEKYDDVYLGYYYDTEKNNIVMIKSGALAEGEDRDSQLYAEMMDYMTNTDLFDNINYEHACELIDIQSYIDYYAAEIYIGRYNDWPNSNYALWRVRETENTRYGDGKWRWMLFDVNSGALSSDLISTDTISSTLKNSKMFYNLSQNDDFKRHFTVTFMDLVNTSFTNENVDSIISDYIDLMAEPMQVHRRRFFGSTDNQAFLDAVADVQNFLDNRKLYIVQYLKDDFGLTGELATIELEINNILSGKVILNTIEPAFNYEGKWNGEYYTDFPITLTAVANDGYRFVGWEITDSSGKEILNEETVEIYITEEEMSIKAVYEKL